MDKQWHKLLLFQVLLLLQKDARVPQAGEAVQRCRGGAHEARGQGPDSLAAPQPLHQGDGEQDGYAHPQVGLDPLKPASLLELISFSLCVVLDFEFITFFD